MTIKLGKPRFAAPCALTEARIGMRVYDTMLEKFGHITEMDDDGGVTFAYKDSTGAVNASKVNEDGRLRPVATRPARGQTIQFWRSDSDPETSGTVADVVGNVISTYNGDYVLTTQWKPSRGWGEASMLEAVADDVPPCALDVERLVNQMTDARKSRNAYEAAVEKDCQTISDAIKQQKERQGWCDEAWKIVGEVNDDLEVLHIPLGMRDFDVEWYETVTVRVHRSGTFTASSEEDAIEEAQQEAGEGLDTDMVVRAARDGNWEYDDCDEFEVV